MPVSLTVCRNYDYTEADIKLNEKQADMLATHRFLDECAETFRYMQVEEMKTASDKATMRGEFICLENIGKEQLMQIELTEN